MGRDSVFVQSHFRIGLYCSAILKWYNNLVKITLCLSKKPAVSEALTLCAVPSANSCTGGYYGGCSSLLLFPALLWSAYDI